MGRKTREQEGIVGNRLEAFLNDGLSQNRCSGGTVAGFVIGAAGDFFHHLRAHVLELVFELDFLGNRHTVFGDARGAEGFIDDHVAAFRAEGHLHRVGKDVDTLEHTVTGICIELDVLSSHSCFPRLSSWF